MKRLFICIIILLYNLILCYSIKDQWLIIKKKPPAVIDEWGGKETLRVGNPRYLLGVEDWGSQPYGALNVYENFPKASGTLKQLHNYGYTPVPMGYETANSVQQRLANGPKQTIPTFTAPANTLPGVGAFLEESTEFYSPIQVATSHNIRDDEDDDQLLEEYYNHNNNGE